VTTAGEAIDTVNKAFGRHPGMRALHAKGILCKGTFTPTPEAATLTTAGHMNGGPVPATFRFSNGGGDPDQPDYAPDLRGLAAKFYLDDGTRADIVAVSAPTFAFKTPEGFIELIDAQGSGPAVAWKLPMVFVRHPEGLRALPGAAAAMRPVASYAVISYYGQHAFRWIDAQGGERWVRYRVRPQAPRESITPWAARGRGRDYLQDELRARLERGPVRFSLEVQIAIPGDPIDDPSAAWPQSRRTVAVGTYEVTGLETERETGGDVLVFDPTRVVDGIELSDDPVLRFRHDAYSESVARRMASS
jgi:catalase